MIQQEHYFHKGKGHWLNHTQQWWLQHWRHLWDSEWGVERRKEFKQRKSAKLKQKRINKSNKRAKRMKDAERAFNSGEHVGKQRKRNGEPFDLRNWLIWHDITQADFSDYIYTPDQTVRRWACGVRAMPDNIEVLLLCCYQKKLHKFRSEKYDKYAYVEKINEDGLIYYDKYDSLTQEKESTLSFEEYSNNILEDEFVYEEDELSIEEAERILASL